MSVARDAAALSKLIRLAHSKLDEGAGRLEALRASLAGVDRALAVLTGSIAEEANAARAAEIVGFVHLAGYLVGAEAKRDALEATRRLIVAEIDLRESELRQLYAELKKLEHLAGRLRDQAALNRRRRDGREIDDVARLLAAGRSRR